MQFEAQKMLLFRLVRHFPWDPALQLKWLVVLEYPWLLCFRNKHIIGQQNWMIYTHIFWFMEKWSLDNFQSKTNANRGVFFYNFLYRWNRKKMCGKQFPCYKIWTYKKNNDGVSEKTAKRILSRHPEYLSFLFFLVDRNHWWCRHQEQVHASRYEFCWCFALLANFSLNCNEWTSMWIFFWFVKNLKVFAIVKSIFIIYTIITCRNKIGFSLS